MLRRVLIAVLLAGVFAAPADASSQTLIPGLTYTRKLLFTPHGAVIVHVLVAPRPGGLWALRPRLSDGAIAGRQRLTGIERDVSATATVAGVNGDFFNAADGRPDGIVMQNRVLASLPNSERSSIGIEPNGTLDVRHAAWNAFWQGRGQRRPLTGLNEPATSCRRSVEPSVVRSTWLIVWASISQPWRIISRICGTVSFPSSRFRTARLSTPGQCRCASSGRTFVKSSR